MFLTDLQPRRSLAQFDVLQYSPLWVDHVTFENGIVSVRGWILSLPPKGAIFLNGEEVREVIWRGGLSEVFDALPENATGSARYSFRHPCPNASLIKIEYRSGRHPDLRSEQSAWYIVQPGHEAFRQRLQRN
jgi:hypothetical protein